MPKAMAYLITKVEALEKVLMEKSEAPAAPMDRWLNIDELKAYLPDHPAKATIYGWVSRREIPYHKGGKKLRFLQSDTKPYTGYLLYSFHVKPDTYEVGVIYVHSPELRKLGIKELHLVKAIKIKK